LGGGAALPPIGAHHLETKSGVLPKAIDAKAANLNDSAHHGGRKNIVVD
jgi:hypothetical protein